MARGLALVLDFTLRQFVAMLLGIGLSNLGGTGIGTWLILSFLIEWFYPVIFEVFENGQTPGKRAFGLRVINRDGTPVNWSASVLRNLLRFADMLPLFYLAGLATMLTSRHFERIGDHAAGTLVVYVPKASEGALDDIVEAVRVPRRPLDPGEQRAILDYAERSGRLSAERCVELAEILEPLTGKRGRDGADELRAIANGVRGRS